MTVPETTVDKYQRVIGWKNQIRFARQFAVVQAIAVAEAMQPTPDGQLRFGVFPPDARHHAGTGVFINDVCQLLYRAFRIWAR